MHLLIQHLLGREGIFAAVSEPEAQFEPCAIRGTTLSCVVTVTQILRSILCCGEHFPIYSVALHCKEYPFVSIKCCNSFSADMRIEDWYRDTSLFCFVIVFSKVFQGLEKR